MAAMSQAEMESFVAEPRIGHLVTLRADGSPHVAPIWYEYRDGAFRVWTSRQTQRVRNILRDARAALSIASEDEPYRYVSVEGTVRVSDQDVRTAALAISQRYEGIEGGVAFVEEWFEEGVSVLLTLTPRRVMTWTDGG